MIRRIDASSSAVWATESGSSGNRSTFVDSEPYSTSRSVGSTRKLIDSEPYLASKSVFKASGSLSTRRHDTYIPKATVDSYLGKSWSERKQHLESANAYYPQLSQTNPEIVTLRSQHAILEQEKEDFIARGRIAQRAGHHAVILDPNVNFIDHALYSLQSSPQADKYRGAIHILTEAKKEIDREKRSQKVQWTLQILQNIQASSSIHSPYTVADKKLIRMLLQGAWYETQKVAYDTELQDLAEKGRKAGQKLYERTIEDFRAAEFPLHCLKLEFDLLRRLRDKGQINRLENELRLQELSKQLEAKGYSTTDENGLILRGPEESSEEAKMCMLRVTKNQIKRQNPILTKFYMPQLLTNFYISHRLEPSIMEYLANIKRLPELQTTRKLEELPDSLSHANTNTEYARAIIDELARLNNKSWLSFLRG